MMSLRIQRMIIATSVPAPTVRGASGSYIRGNPAARRCPSIRPQAAGPRDESRTEDGAARPASRRYSRPLVMTSRLEPPTHRAARAAPQSFDGDGAAAAVRRPSTGAGQGGHGASGVVRRFVRSELVPAMALLAGIATLLAACGHALQP